MKQPCTCIIDKAPETVVRYWPSTEVYASVSLLQECISCSEEVCMHGDDNADLAEKGPSSRM